MFLTSNPLYGREIIGGGISLSPVARAGVYGTVHEAEEALRRIRAEYVHACQMQANALSKLNKARAAYRRSGSKADAMSINDWRRDLGRWNSRKAEESRHLAKVEAQIEALRIADELDALTLPHAA
ncbi:conserved protein of unknown function (plasmid) [Rhodovastum atsumiense]|uniref:Uncharacterized protein n=1 Tax=Rhodovastum atsumiense TaxID=504468 RepID=A0A5M6INX5_9PROT|nr:hypothetical protein [Rhodovastum atsumiense]KAA5609687.1 hypothetical protein F1189_23290 [Rhodovastum atsumiense]CAH2606459.1 conserved protein of unknown function [Rhodovastum atsumiense]